LPTAASTTWWSRSTRWTSTARSSSSAPTSASASKRSHQNPIPPFPFFFLFTSPFCVLPCTDRQVRDAHLQVQGPHGPVVAAGAEVRREVSSALRLFLLLTDLRWSRWELNFLVTICCKLQGDHGEAPGAVGAVEAAARVPSGGEAVVI
jgi:hypothetical protein